MGKWIAIGLGVLALPVVALFLASELGGEVVTLYTSDEEGGIHATSLWVVEDHNQLWLRGGDPESGWLLRLQQNSEVELERDGERRPYRATAVASQGDRVNGLMAEKYGMADSLIGLMRDAGGVTAVRLDAKSRHSP